MLYLNQSEVNTLTLNINENTRQTFQTYLLKFTHILSSEVYEYSIDTNDPNVYFSNIRYCTIQLDLTGENHLPYEGQYIVDIYGNGTYPVYNGFAMVEGTVENNPFTEYISPNESNENYIYIQD